MSLVFFEGFETIGTDIGEANEALVNARLEKRMDVNNMLSVEHMYLINGIQGFAWHMGDTAGNSINFDLPAANKVVTGPEAPVFVIGALVHVPSVARSEKIFSVSHSGSFEPNVYMENSTHLEVRVSADTIERVENALTPGNWHFIEWKVRPCGNRGPRGTATVAGTPLDGATTVSISDLEVYLPVWRLQETYDDTVPDQVRYDGLAYEAQEVLIDSVKQTNIGKRPDLYSDPGDPDNYFWSELGDESGYRPDEIPFGAQFYFEGYPQYLYTRNNFPPSAIQFTPALDEDLFLPQNGDDIFIGTLGLYQVDLDGNTIMGEEDTYTMTEGDQRTLDDLEFTGSPSSVATDDYFAFDDIYIKIGDENETLLGRVQVRSLPPNTDATPNQWEAFPDSTPHYPKISANASPETTYVFTTEDGYVEHYGHSAVGETGIDIFGVKVEAEVTNNTAGSPELELAIFSGASSDTVQEGFENDGDTHILDLISETDPAGGDWDVSSVDSSTVKLTFDSGF